MRKLVIILTLAAAAVFTGLLTFTADAQTWKRGAAGLAAQNFTPVEKAACWGWGARCPPGRTWVCRWGNCWCARC
jgi:hypothetical protein